MYVNQRLSHLKCLGCTVHELWWVLTALKSKKESYRLDRRVGDGATCSES